MLAVDGSRGDLLFLAAWAIIASLMSLYLGYRRYVQRDDERDKRCHHTLDVDQRILLVEALNVANIALSKGIALPSGYRITSTNLDALYKLLWWADYIELNASSPFDEAADPD